MATKIELEKQLKEVEQEILSSRRNFDPKKHKDETRAKIALFVVRAFFILIGIVLIGVPLYNLFVNDTRMLSVVDLISMLSGVISAPFGFVVGYYFKGTEDIE